MKYGYIESQIKRITCVQQKDKIHLTHEVKIKMYKTIILLVVLYGCET
jgi:hypothetical protein